MIPRRHRDAVIAAGNDLRKTLRERARANRIMWWNLAGLTASVCLGNLCAERDWEKALTVTYGALVIALILWHLYVTLSEAKEDARMLGWIAEVEARMRSLPVADDPSDAGAPANGG